MLRAFSTAATGMTAQQMMLDVTSNNLANMNTTGFKRSQVNFQDLFYVKMKDAGTEVSAGMKSPSGLEVGSGVRAASTVKVFTAGEPVSTERDLDLAIDGDGFFQVTMPDGSIRYTRDGALQRGPNGELMTNKGYLIEPAVTIPTDCVSIDIGTDGGVNVTDSTGSQSVVGNIQLARFPNPSGLSSTGDNLLAETEASGAPTTGTPGENGYGLILAQFLEKSNVQMVTELVNLITAQRSYETTSRAIRAADDMLQTAIQVAQ